MTCNGTQLVASAVKGTFTNAEGVSHGPECTVDAFSPAGLGKLTVASEGTGTITVLDPPGADPAVLPAGTTRVKARLSGLPLGPHTFAAFGRQDQETRLSWSVERIELAFSSATRAVIDPATGRFRADLVLELSGSRNMFSLEALKAPGLDPTNQEVHSSTGLSGTVARPVLVLETSPFWEAPLGTTRLALPGQPAQTLDAPGGGFQFYARDAAGGTLSWSMVAVQDLWAGAMPSSGPAKPYPWEPVASTGTQASPLYDLFEGDAKVLPGAVIPSGAVRELAFGTFGPLGRQEPVKMATREVGKIGDLKVGRQVVGRVALSVRTGDAPETLGPPVNLIEADVLAGGGLEPTNIPNAYIPVLRFFKLGLTVTKVQPAFVATCEQFQKLPDGSDSEICARAPDYAPYAVSAGDGLAGQIVLATGTYAPGVPLAAGAGQRIPINMGVTASGLNATRSGFMIFGQTQGLPDRGFRGHARDAGLFLASHPAAPVLSGNFQAAVSYDPGDLTAGQESFGRLVRVSTEGVRTRTAAVVDAAAKTMTFELAAPERISPAEAAARPPDLLELETPDYPDPAVVELPGLELVSNRAGAAASAGSASLETIAALKAQGLHLASPAFTLSASTTLSPPGILKLDYNPETSLALGFPLEDLFIAKIDPTGTVAALAAPVTDRINSWVTAEITDAQGLYAVLASSPVAPPEPPPPPPPTPDTVAPVTTVHVGVSSFTDSGGTLFVGTSALVSFSAEDPLPGSGLARIETSLDGGGFAAFTAAFTLAEGTHTIQYRAADLAGNLETTKSLSLTSDGQAPNTALLINGLAAAGGELSLSATDQISLSSTDTVSGVSAISYSLDGAPLADFTTAFALVPGTHTVSFSAVDRVGNLEVPRAVAITVRQVPNFDLAPFLAGGRLLGACSGIDIKGTASLSGNVAANGLVSLAGNAVLDGNVSAGTLRSVGKSAVTGSQSTGTVDCSPVDLPALLAQIQGSALPAPSGFNRAGALVVDGRRTLSLASGTYLVSGLTVTGGAALEVSGKVNLFVRGPISVDGRAIVNRGPTTDLAVFSDSALPVRLSGGAYVRAILYAPNASLIVTGGATARGHFQAREADIAGSALAVANPDGTVHDPRDLRVLGRSSTTLELEWNPNGSPEGTAFSVEWTVGDYSCAQLPPDTHGFAVVTTASRTVITGLMPSTTHLIHVHAELLGGGVTEGHTNYVTAATRGPGEGFTTSAPFDICGENLDPGAVTSAVLFPAHGSTVTSLLTISGTAASQAGISEVGVSVQRASDGRYWNGSSYGPNAVFVLAAGTTNWVLNSPFAIHSGSGVFFITSRASDSAGALQQDFTRGVALVEVTRRLNAPADFRVPSVSSSGFTTEWQANGNPPGTRYKIHYTTGDCGVHDFGFPAAAFSPETEGSALAVSNLESSQFYTLHLHVLDADGRDDTGEGGALVNLSVKTQPAGDPTTNSQFLVCGNPTDTTPGFSEIIFFGPSTNQAGGYTISTATLVGFRANDTFIENTQTSGIARINYLLDQVFLDTAATPGQVFNSPFALSQGTHSVAFYSVDNAGNYEGAKTVTVIVGSAAPPPPPSFQGDGLALGADSQGNIWEVFRLPDGVAAAKFGPDGAFISSASLPGAQEAGRFSISFAPSGEPVVVGNAGGAGGDPVDVAVYRLALDGSRVLSSATIDSGFGNLDVALDSAGDVWIAGAAVTAGSPETGDLQAKLALWHYRPAENLLSLATTYSGAGRLDGGFGIALDPTGHVWVAGFTRNPAPASLESLDLALWKFRPDGSALAAGPFVRTGFARNVDDAAQARIAYADNALFVAANKFETVGGTDLHLLRFGLDGALQFEKRWSGAAGQDETVRDIAADGTGVAVAGDADGGQKIAVWRYGFQGGLQSALTDPGVFSAQEILLRPGRTWLAAAQSSAPYPFQGAQLLAGQDLTITADTGAPSLTIEPVNGSTATTPRPLVAAGYADASGVDPASVRLFLDGTEVTAQAVVTASSISFRPSADLAQGAHLASATAADFAGNAAAAFTSFIIDSAPPVTLLVIGTPRFGAAPIKITTQTPLGFAVSEAGRTFFAVDAGTFTLFTGAVTLSTEGLRTVRFFSEDTAGNRETARTETLGVDASAPDTQLRLTGTAFSAGSLFIASSTLVGFTAQDPVVDLVAAGVARTEFRLDASTSFAAFDAGFTLPEGAHALVYRSVDNLGQFETNRSTSITSDATPPMTALLVNGQAAGGINLVAISTDAFSFTSTDTASGVAAVGYSLDNSPITEFSAAFTLAPGSHSLAYFAVDNVGNLESSRTIAVAVTAPDTSAPSLALSPVHGSTVTTARPLIIAAFSDPSGIDLGSFRISLDATDVTALAAVGASSASFQPAADLAQGTHTAVARVADLAGHVATATSTFFIDSLAPQTAVLIGEPRFGAGPVFVSSRTLLGFAASEPAQTFYAVDSMSFAAFTSSFTLATEGLRAIAYFSKDTAGNQEVVRTTHVFADNTPPVTAFQINGIPATGTQLAATTTDFFSLVSTDTASGLARILFSLDGNSEAPFAAAFSLAPGTHTVSFRAEDNVRNLENLRTVTLTVAGPDAQAPALSLAPANGSTVTTTAPAIRAFYSDEGSGIDPASIRLFLDGVDVTSSSLVTASSAVFTPATALAQGTHLVTADAADRAGNRSSARAGWFLDSLAPVTALLLNGQAALSPVVASSTDSFSLSAVDAGTGVADILYALDGGAEQVFNSPFSLAAGNHTLSFHARDRAGNLEAVQTAVVAIPAGGAVVTLDLKPETLNLAAFGQFLSAHLEVTGGGTAAQIATNTVRVSHVDDRPVSPPVFIDPKGPVSLSDEDGDGAPELKVKFPREQISAVLPGNAQPKVTVSGAFADGRTFSADDTIRTLGKGLTTAVDPDETGLALIAAYAFPNPAKGVNPTIRLQTRGTADIVTITIYNVFREVVHVASPGAPQRVDGRWTYDYPWDASGRRTGVYTFRINARRAGFPEINAVGRVAVIR